MSESATIETKPLGDSVALVTGAARGLGRVVCQQLADAGAAVVAFDAAGVVADVPYPAASEHDLAETVEAVTKSGGRILGVRGDVRRPADLTGAIDRAQREFGGLDVVVANAGITTWGRMWQLTDEQWTTMMDINLTGCWQTLRAAAPALISGGRGGSITAVSSVAGLKPLPGLSHYSAAKAGVIGLVRAAATELGRYNIRVNSVHPWAMDTAMGRTEQTTQLLVDDPGYASSYNSVLAVPLPANPALVANAITWLASPAAAGVTGAQIPIDQGATLV